MGRRNRPSFAPGGLAVGFKRVLIVEDEFLIAEALAIIASDLGLAVCGRADTAEDAIGLAREHRPDLVFMDVRLKGARDGVDAALAIRSNVATPLIFITGSREPSTLARMRLVPGAGILFKPFQFEQIETAVKRALA